MGSVYLNDGFHDSLLHTLQSVKLFIQDLTCPDGIDGSKIFALPLNVQNHLQGSLRVTALLGSDGLRPYQVNVSVRPGLHVLRKCISRAGYEIQHGIKIPKILMGNLCHFIIHFLIQRRLALFKAFNDKLKEAVSVRLYVFSVGSHCPDLVNTVAFLPALTGKSYGNMIFTKPPLKVNKPFIYLQDVVVKIPAILILAAYVCFNLSFSIGK